MMTLNNTAPGAVRGKYAAHARYELTIAATGEVSRHADLGDAFQATAKATGIDRAVIAESGFWRDGTFLGGYDDDGSDSFTIRETDMEVPV